MSSTDPAALRDLTRSLAGTFAFCGVAVDGDCVSATALGIVGDADTPFRTASVSKVVVGQVFAAVAHDAGLAFPYAVDAGAVLGWPLRHPDYPDRPVTLGMLASHSAGLTDAAYAVPPDMALRDFVTLSAVWGAEAPGTCFRYANLGYILLAAAAERLAGARFDSLAARLVLDPLGIAGGFNWSGVPAMRRAVALPTYRHDGAGFGPQIDADLPADGVVGPGGQSLSLANYVPGHNPAVFSPQGGLRMSLRDMGLLAASLRDVPPRPLWRQTDGPGDYLDGVFADYGTGVQIFDAPTFYPRPLIGHFGNAYGFNGGIWYDRLADRTFAYALNGLPMGDESDAFSPAELNIFAAIAALES